MNQETIGTETRWESESVIENGTSVKLIVEVVSQCVARVPRVEATDVRPWRAGGITRKG
ncbi:MAG: hypothetical protein V7K83_27520 [Nostoc sp.]